MTKWSEHRHSEEYIPEGDGYIPIETWGEEHWSTFAYLETRAVDGKGVIANTRMRCDPRLHREFALVGGAGWYGTKYPTRLKGGELVYDHYDWSCLEDMVAAGLMRSWFQEQVGQPFGGGVAKVEFTPFGWGLAAQLREHKGRGGTFANFAPLLPAEGAVAAPVESAVVVEAVG